jgi:hypothetical protein
MVVLIVADRLLMLRIAATQLQVTALVVDLSIMLSKPSSGRLRARPLLQSATMSSYF